MQKKGQNLILGLPLQRIKQYEQKSYFLVPLPVFFFLVVLQAISEHLLSANAQM